MRKRILILVAVALAVAVGVGILGSDENDSIQRGEEISTDLGCFGCHGDRGMGGITNPGSPLGTVPGWQTKAFAEVFGTADGKPDRDKIGFMIVEGAEAYYEKYMAHDAAAQTIARSIADWERQMPAYKDEMSEGEVEDVVNFIISLNPFYKD